jgi:DNA modification methylase
VGGALLLCGDARQLPLADGSVDLVVTSPPYFGLRDYGTPGQIGAEVHWRDFIDALLECTAEMVRVLKPEGSIFLNLGDKYSGAGPQNAEGRLSSIGNSDHWRQVDPNRSGIPNKSLMLLPERYRIACVDTLGLIARAVIVWDKPNGLPESVKDRVRRSHEDWVHLTKSPRYYSAVDEIREAYDGKPQRRGGTDHQVGEYRGRNKQTLRKCWDEPLAGTNPLGKLPGSVWTIASEPLQVPDHLGVDHYAAMPSEWPRRLILGWSPPGICTVCGQGRWPVVDRPGLLGGDNNPYSRDGSKMRSTMDGGSKEWAQRISKPDTILGYACACTPHTDHPERRQPTVTPGRMLGRGPGVQEHREDLGYSRHHGNDWPERRPVRDYHLAGWTPPPSRPAVVLDPFCGTGTTCMVARALGRTGVGVDLSADYLRLAEWRVWHSGAAGKAISRTNLERQGALL